MVKIERSFPAPASLAAGKSYSGEDVIEQLRHDFHDKCYICELDKLSDVEVEHLLPHKNGTYPERLYDWENLFFACRHCNGVKNKEKYDSGIIDCCKEDPEQEISFVYAEDNVIVMARFRDDAKAALTAELVTETFTQKNTGIRTYAASLRMKELGEEMLKLYTTLDKMIQNPGSRYQRRKLEALLGRESRFAAFKREYVRMNAERYSKLMELLA